MRSPTSCGAFSAMPRSLQLPAPFRLHEHILILGALVAGGRQPSPRSLTPPWAMEGTAPPPSPTTSSGMRAAPPVAARTGEEEAICSCAGAEIVPCFSRWQVFVDGHQPLEHKRGGLRWVTVSGSRDYNRWGSSEMAGEAGSVRRPTWTP